MGEWEISKRADYEIIIDACRPLIPNLSGRDTLSLSASSVALHLKCIVVCTQPLNNKSAPQEKVSVHCHYKLILITIILPYQMSAKLKQCDGCILAQALMTL